MVVVPFLVAGPLVLMVWERQTQASSWWTLLSLQIPVGILSVIKISRTARTETEIDDGDDDGSGDDGSGDYVSKNVTIKKEGKGMASLLSSSSLSSVVSSLSKLKIRSGLIYLSVFFMCCFQEQGLLSRGTGYLIPYMAVILIWIDIITTMLFPKL